jgi:hypothetical protein
MKKHANLILALCLVVSLVLASIQARRVYCLRDATAFYRWILAAAAQLRTDGSFIPPTEYPPEKKWYDEELFQSVSQTVQGKLEDLPTTADPDSALVDYIAPEGVGEDFEADEGKAMPQKPAEQAARDRAVWQFAASDVLKSEREAFVKHAADGDLMSLGTQFTISDIYGEHGTVANLSNMLFGFRIMAANLIWLQIDKYWHQGAYYRMLPLMKTCVALDPKFVDAYLVGAWHIAYNATASMLPTPEKDKKWSPRYRKRLGKKEEYYYDAIDFLKDGIRKNPRDYRLYFDLGYAILEQKMDDHANAVKYLSEAVRYPHEKWVERMLYLVLRLNNQFEEAIEGWNRYELKEPGNKFSARFIPINRAHIAEREAMEARDLAEAARAEAEKAQKAALDAQQAAEKAVQVAEPNVDALLAKAEKAQETAQSTLATAQQKEATAAELYAKARQTWQEITDVSGSEETLAYARGLIMDASKLIEQGRYYEANGLLDHARFKSAEVFQEASDLIIESKFAGGIPLELTEVKAVERKTEAERYLPKTVDGVLYQYRDDGFYAENFNDQTVQALEYGSAELEQLQKRWPQLMDVLDLGHPGDRIVFQVEDAWYSVYKPAEVESMKTS